MHRSVWKMWETLNQEGMGKRRRRGHEPQKGWRSDRMSGWLTKRGKKCSCSQEAQKTSQKQRVEKVCSCSWSVGMRRTASSIGSQSTQGWEDGGAVDISNATRKEAASALLMNCMSQWLFSPARGAKRCWEQLIHFLLSIYSTIVTLVFKLKPWFCY